MNRSTAAFLVGTLVLLSACATQTRTAAPVNLKISSRTANDHFVTDVRDATIAAIRAQVPNARPMTIAVNLDVTTEWMSLTPWVFYPQPNQQRVVAILSPNPQTEAAPPTVSVNNSAFITDPPEITSFYVSYTISDAEGHLVESKRLTFEEGRLVDAVTGMPVDGSGKIRRFSLRRDPVRDTARFLASRVKSLSQ